jgi:hypothetical protein
MGANCFNRLVAGDARSCKFSAFPSLSLQYLAELNCSSDGPALRASAVIDFCNQLLDQDAGRWEDWIKSDIYDSLPFETTQSLVKADLDFVAK